MLNVLNDRRALITLALCATIAAYFWTGSRYPQLNEKATMGTEIVLEDPLGFDAMLEVSPLDGRLKQVAYTTANWVDTNKKGMTFGIVFAAAFMTLLPLLRRVRPQSRFGSSLLGVVMGAPLGVCANCAAPIARGLHAAGARSETTLAAMISSPTLNIVVLAMLFSLFPLHLALIKLGATVLFLLIGIPLLSRLIPDTVAPAALGQSAAGGPVAPQADPEPDHGWLSASGWVARQFARNLWFIVRYTVPLMLLAGFLGALLVTFLPWDTISAALPATGRWSVLAALSIAAAVGLFLPVPIAFDVVICAALLSAGLDEAYVMVLLFTLGIFSVYSYMIVWQAMSARTATLVAVAIAVLGVATGIAARKYEAWDAPRQRTLIFETFRQAQAATRPALELPAAASHAEIAGRLGAPAHWAQTAARSPAGITVLERGLAGRSAGGDTQFVRSYGEDHGLHRVDHVPLTFKFRPPFYRDWPVAAGDVHGDGRIDVLLGSDQGMYLHANLGGSRFALQEIAVPALAGAYIANAALVDLDGDGWLDIFASAYRGGNHVVYNDRGRFTAAGWRALPPSAATVANAAAFGDLDEDGDLDIVLGNWFAGSWTEYPPEAARDAVLWNDGDGFRAQPLPGLPGETLSVLVSDIDGDGHLDVYVGNDYGVPDAVYLGDGTGGLRQITPADGVVPHTARLTMSVDSADLDNDLAPEIFVVGQSAGASGQAQRLHVISAAQECAQYDREPWRERCRQRQAVRATVHRSLLERDVSGCAGIAAATDRVDCVAHHLLVRAIKRERRVELCADFPAGYERYQHICRQAFTPPFADSRRLSTEGLAQARNTNVLLARSTNAPARFTDRAAELGINVSGWSWNAKFADLDNDRWQDLFVVSGTISSDRRESSMWFRNRGGTGFEDATIAAGLRNHHSSGSYVYADLDDDGDLDIVNVAFDGPVWLYTNNEARNNSVQFELEDHAGNRFGVGSRIVIRHADGTQQVREIKAGGGYLSFDPHLAHFGLGAQEKVDTVEVHWSTGERSEIAGPFTANRRYRIVRGG